MMAPLMWYSVSWSSWGAWQRWKGYNSHHLEVARQLPVRYFFGHSAARNRLAETGRLDPTAVGIKPHKIFAKVLVSNLTLFKEINGFIQGLWNPVQCASVPCCTPGSIV